MPCKHRNKDYGCAFNCINCILYCYKCGAQMKRDFTTVAYSHKDYICKNPKCGYKVRRQTGFKYEG